MIKAKTAFAQGMLLSLLSTGRALFVGYNRETQWTKYWIMDLIEETQPALWVMTDVIRLLRVNRKEMAKQAETGFLGATFLMEWMVKSFRLPLRQAKGIVERAVKYSEREGEGRVSFRSLKKVLEEMKIRLPISEREIEEIQSSERVLFESMTVGTPSTKRVLETLRSLRERVRQGQAWVKRKRGRIEKAMKTMEKMEKQI